MSVNSGVYVVEKEEIKETFDSINTYGSVIIDPKELLAALELAGFNSRNPTIVSLIGDLNTPEAVEKGGVDFNTVSEAIDKKLGDSGSVEGLARIFNMFVENPESKTITLSGLRRIFKEISEDISEEELKELLERASSNGTEFTFEEFCEIMLEKSSD